MANQSCIASVGMIQYCGLACQTLIRGPLVNKSHAKLRRSELFTG
jgi:hypothetical protein